MDRRKLNYPTVTNAPIISSSLLEHSLQLQGNIAAGQTFPLMFWSQYGGEIYDGMIDGSSHTGLFSSSNGLPIDPNSNELLQQIEPFL